MKNTLSLWKDCPVARLKLSPHCPPAQRPAWPRHLATSKSIKFGVPRGALPGQDVFAKLPEMPDERYSRSMGNKAGGTAGSPGRLSGFPGKWMRFCVPGTQGDPHPQQPRLKAKGSSAAAGKRRVCWQCWTCPVYRQAGRAKEGQSSFKKIKRRQEESPYLACGLGLLLALERPGKKQTLFSQRPLAGKAATCPQPRLPSCGPGHRLTPVPICHFTENFKIRKNFFREIRAVWDSQKHLVADA